MKHFVPKVSEVGTSVSLQSQSHAHPSVSYFPNDVWLSYAMDISLITTAFFIPQSCSCTKTSQVVQHLVPMCSCLLYLEETCQLLCNPEII